ncbi:MAG: leucine-rich repeat protein [Ruminococcus sp.]|nr:leucine-rich repeat protein [Ruminococcus sp.]
MNMKKLLAGVLACCVVGGVIPTVEKMTSNNVMTAGAVDDYVEGTYEQLTYNNYGDHIEISGCDKSATEVVIPAEIEGVSVTSIGNSAFSSCKHLKSVTIPDSITNIEYYAFKGCSDLTSIEIPDSVTSIESSAFASCINLTSIKISNSITRIEDSVFSYCKCLTSIEIPNSVTSIGIGTFSNCESLTSITIPDSVTSIYGSAFSYCTGLTSVEIPDSVESIEEAVFSNCIGLTSVTIPNSVKTIGISAFNGCSSLKSIEIPDSVTSISTLAFSRCTDLTSIKILNPECFIHDDKNTISNGLNDDSKHYFNGTICSYDNSTAQAYAEKYNCKFESLGKAPAIEQPDVNILGDANCDGAVNIADATAIVQHLGNQDKYGLSEHGLINADCCNVGDGVTGLDALAIQKLEAGMIDSLPDTN